jgi:hypothetical protein
MIGTCLAVGDLETLPALPLESDLGPVYNRARSYHPRLAAQVHP